MAFEELASSVFPNVGGTISYTYNNSVAYIPSIIMAGASALVILIIIMGICSILKSRKSYQYRNLIGDMYVVGMIKKFAKDDGIDLIAELQEFNRIIKKEKLSREKDLGDIVEQELNEKIANVSEEKLDKKQVKEK